MQLRRWTVAGVATVVVASGAAVYLWRAQALAHVRPGDTVSLGAGQVTFRAPWDGDARPAPPTIAVA